MINQELLQFIRQQISAGVSPEEARTALVRQGWPESDINEGFAEIAKVPQSPQTIVQIPAIPVEQFTGRPTIPVFSAPDQSPQVSQLPSRGKRGLVVIFMAVFLFIILAGGGYAYFTKWGLFARPPYTQNNLVSGLLSAASRIESSSYRFSGSLTTDPRDKDAVPFVTSKTNDRELIDRYHHDVKRAEDISGILQILLYARSNPSYPSTLQVAVNKANLSYSSYRGKISIADPVSNQSYGYALTENGKNFALTVTFETDSAITQLKQSYRFSATSTSVEGKRVTFTKDSSSYIYFPQDLPKPALLQFSEMLGSFPPEASASISVSAQTSWRDADSDWKFNVGAAGDFGDLSYKFDADALKKNDAYYFKINNIPSLFLGSYASIKGQWIKIDASIASSTAADYYNLYSSLASQLPEAEKSYKERRKEFADVFKKAAAIADEERLFIISEGPRSERVDGRLLYRYGLKINKGALVPFYKRLLNETSVAKTSGGALLISDTGYIEYLQSSEFNAIFDYYDKNTALTLWADTQGFPAVVSYSMRVVPPDTATQLKNKQIGILFKFEAGDINKPVNIDEPKDAKPIQELIGKENLSGPVMKSRDARRIADIKQLQLALELYYDAHSGYPASLSALAGKSSCGRSSCVPVIPNDPLNKATYYYTYHSLGSKRNAYHLGASLEDSAGYGLSGDSDCNSRTNTGCTVPGGAWSKTSAFDGGDGRGCGGEADRYCYDVTP